MKKMSIIIKNNYIYILLCCINLISCENTSIRNQKASIKYKKIANGNLLPIGVEINGRKEGLWLTYNDDGILILEECFINNVENGPFQGYYDWNGQLQSKGTLLNGFDHGYFEQYNSNGTLYRKGNMNNGVCDGIWELYTDHGLLNKKVEYKEGKIIKVFFDNKLEIPPPPLKKGN